jgi:hypothetical protein
MSCMRLSASHYGLLILRPFEPPCCHPSLLPSHSAIHFASLTLQDAADQDPNTFVLSTTKQWVAWPRGCSKSIARIFRDPLFYYTAFPTFFVLVFNSSWPQRVTHQPQSTRALYILWRAALVSGGLVAYIKVAANWTHFAVRCHGDLLL